MTLSPRVLVASAVFVGALAGSGYAVASAQTTSTSPNSTPGSSTPAPNQGTAPNGQHNCPNMGGSGGSGNSGSSYPMPPNVNNSV